MGQKITVISSGDPLFKCFVVEELPSCLLLLKLRCSVKVSEMNEIIIETGAYPFSSNLNCKLIFTALNNYPECSNVK